MRKKHYEAIAENFSICIKRSELESNADTEIYNALYNLAVNMGNDFMRDNPLYDHSKFMKACGFGK